MSGPVTPPLEVTEVDGSPDGRPITKLIVSNGDLTISGRTATIDTSGSGGIPGTPAQSIQFNSDPAGTFSGSERLLFETGSNNAQIFIKSGASATQTEIRAVDGWGIQIGSTNADNSIRNQIAFMGENDGPDGILLSPNTGENVTLLTGGLTTSASDGDLVLSTYGDEDKAKITLEAGADGGIVLQTDNAGVTQLENTTTNADSVLSIMGNGTGDAKLDLQNASMRVWVLCDENKKLKIQGGAAGNTFVFDVTSATGGITWPDGTTQITAASGGTPAGSDTEIQFNNAGAFGASSDLTWDGTYLMSDKISSTASTDLNLYGGSASSGKITLLNGFGNHITITPSGTGDIKLQADQIIVGDDAGVADAIITTDGAGDLTLSTNKGTNSGTIVITDGVDGDISITPDGAGAVEVSGAYKLPTAVTASNDYALVAQTDGTTAWAAVTASVPDPLLLSDGDVTDPTYSFSGDTDTGMYLGASNQIAFTTEGIQRMTMSANGLGVQPLGTTAFPSISFTTDSNTGIYSAGADILNLAGGGSDFLEMQHDGAATDFRVGTGTGEARISSDGSQNLILHTNNGTNSGTITIQQGTNQDLLIEPDGTGVISFYTGANAWTIENGQGAANQVLTTDGAGAATWEDAGGGGNEYNVELCGTTLDSDGSGYGVFDVLSLPPYGVARYNTVTIDAKQYFFPFISPFSGDLATLYYNITSAAGSATNLYLAVYADNEGVPSDVMGYATIDATVAGSASTTSFSSTITCVRGTQYWVSYNKSTTQALILRGIDNAYCPRISPSSGFPSTTNGYSTNMSTNSSFSSTPANITADGLEPGVVFAGLGYKPHVGFAL